MAHKADQPGSGQWVMSTLPGSQLCFDCNSWQYAIIFWNEKIGVFTENNYFGINSDEKVRVAKFLKRVNREAYTEHPEVPVMFGNSTNWKPKPFMRLSEFLDRIDPP